MAGKLALGMGFLGLAIATAGGWHWQRAKERTSSAPSQRAPTKALSPTDTHVASVATPQAASAANTPPLPDALDCAQRDQVLAKIDVTEIKTGAICDELSVTSGLGPTIPGLALQEFGKPALERLADSVLIGSALRKRGLEVTAKEVQVELGRRGAETKGATGLDRNILERQLRARLERAKLVQHFGTLSVSDAEIASEYAAGQARWAFETGPASAEGFLWRLDAGPRASDVDEGQSAMAALAKDLRSKRGATRLAPGPKIQRLGTLKIRQENAEPELATAVLALAQGAVSEPVRIRTGWVVLVMLEAPERRPRSLAEASPAVRQVLEARRRAQEEKRILDELRRDTPIEYYVRW